MVRRYIDETERMNRLLNENNGHGNFADDEFLQDNIENGNVNDNLSDDENDLAYEPGKMNIIDKNNLDVGFGNLSISDFLLEESNFMTPDIIEEIQHGAILGFSIPDKRSQAAAIARYNYYRSINCFATVHCVLDGSPADIAGIREKDKILEFGPVDVNNFRDIFQLHKVVRQSVGKPIAVLVKRGEVNVNLSVIPRHWEKSGLIGCQIMSRWTTCKYPYYNSHCHNAESKSH